MPIKTNKDKSWIVLANALIAGLEILIPKITELVKSGEISAEEQQAVRNKYAKLKDNLDAEFSGPEWQVEPPPPTEPPTPA